MYCCSHSGSSTMLPKTSAVGQRQRHRAHQEIAPREQAQVDDRMGRAQLPHQEERRSRRRPPAPAARSRSEPNQSSSLPLSTMICIAPTHSTSSARPMRSSGTRRGGCCALAEDRPGDRRRQQAHRDVDVEDPRPGDVVGDPAAEQRPDHRRHQHRHAPQRHRHAGQRARVARQQQRLRQRDHRPGHQALQHAEEDQRLDGRRQAAQPRGERRTAGCWR